MAERAPAYITPKAPLAVNAVVTNATPTEVQVTGTVNVATTYLTQATTQAATDLEALFRSLPVGGTVYLSVVIGVLMQVQGVRNTAGVALNTEGDIALAVGHVATLTNMLDFVGV